MLDIEWLKCVFNILINMYKLSSLLLILLIWLQYSLWFGKNGIFDLIYINNTIKLYQDNNNIVQMKIRNDLLLYEINDLIYGYAAIEERSRYDLGMIKSEETFYRTVS